MARRRPQNAARRPPNVANNRVMDLWRPVPPLPPPPPIVPARDPTALLRSLGDPPLPGQAAGHYLAAVVQRAAGLATALAATAGLLAEPDEA
jgi:hypothetical protein